MSPVQGSHWKADRASNFAEWMARSLLEGFDQSRWTSPQMSSLANCLGKWPNCDQFQALIECLAKSQALQISCQCHVFKALVVQNPKGQAFQAAWQRHPFQTLVKHLTKFQSFQVSWQVQLLKVLVKVRAEIRAWQTVWQGHSLKISVHAPTKSQTLQTAWQGRSFFNALIEVVTQGQALHMLGRATIQDWSWSLHERSNFAGFSGRPLFRGSCWTSFRISNWVNGLANLLLQDTGWSSNQKSSSANCLAR